jgi:hypothetical protein
MLMKRTDGLRFSRTRRVFLTFSAVAMIVAAAIGSYTGRAGAEAGGQQGAQQVQLTGKQVEQYLAAFKELTPLFETLDQAGDKPDPKTLAAVEAAVKKYGFRDLADYDAVAGSIVAVLDGVDPKTKQYTDPVVSIKQAIADVQKDKSMKPADRKQAIQELNEELTQVQPVQHKANIPLVLKYYDRLSAISQQK